FFFNQILRFAVPLFFMISGFVLELNYPFHQNYLTYLKKRFNRIFLPYLFWSAIYYFFVYKTHTISFLQSLLTGNASYQLYFIPALLIFYIIFPLIHRYYKFLAKPKAMIALGTVELCLLAFDYYINPLPFFYPLSIAVLNFYIFLLGMVFSHHHKVLFELIKKWKFILISLFVVLSFTVFFEGKILYMNTHNYLYVYIQWRPSILIYTLVVAGLLYAFFNGGNKFYRIIHGLSKLSFFAFFIHVIILELFWFAIGNNLFHTTGGRFSKFWFDPLFFLSVAALSYLFAYLIRKIPYLSKITG
ncbi:MAG: acyltransferase, partial [bacterium]|nr:acyltransferase [bacterium]